MMVRLLTGALLGPVSKVDLTETSPKQLLVVRFVGSTYPRRFASIIIYNIELEKKYFTRTQKKTSSSSYNFAMS